MRNVCPMLQLKAYLSGPTVTDVVGDNIYLTCLIFDPVKTIFVTAVIMLV